MIKPRVLGKGLQSLMPQRDAAPAVPAIVVELAIDDIETNASQPRRDFQEGHLEELAASIRADGIIQPLIVRPMGGKYQLIAGERRLRAAKLAGLSRVPVSVQQINDDRILEVALIENIQREDLNAIELATAFERMVTELGLSHEEIGTRTGKDRATITNAIRLLQLPADLQRLISEKQLSPGHARALLRIPDEAAQRETANRVIRENWSVRETEEKLKATPAGTRKSRVPSVPSGNDANVRAAIQELEAVLGTRVRIQETSGGKGQIEIEFYSNDDLDRIYSLITSSGEKR